MLLSPANGTSDTIIYGRTLKWLGFLILTHIIVERRQVIEARGVVRVVLPKDLLRYFHCLLEKRFGFLILAH